MPILFLLFILVPVVEMNILIKVGAVIGGLYTIGLVLLTALIGVNLLKKQGLSTFMTAQQKMNSGQMPVTEMAEGLMLAVAGALLLTPGFVTDTVGFFLLTPILRQRIAKQVFQAWLAKTKRANMFEHTHYYSSQQGFDTRTESKRDSSGVIEGEFQEVSDEKIEKK
ncbi:MAG: FxsA family protein [Oleiphilus sp.]